MKRFLKRTGAVILSVAMLLTFMPVLPAYANSTWDTGDLNIYEFENTLLPDSEDEGLYYDIGGVLGDRNRWNFRKRLLDTLAEEGSITKGIAFGERYFIDSDDVWDIEVVSYENGAKALRLNPVSDIHGEAFYFDTDFFEQYPQYEGKQAIFHFPQKPYIVSDGRYIEFGKVYYTGKAVHPSFKVKYKDQNGNTKTLVKGTDYKIIKWTNNVNAGKGTLYIQGIGRYRGTMDSKFTIKPVPMNSAMITYKDLADLTWNGKTRKPIVRATYNGSKLKKYTDYTVTYKYNRNVGTARVILIGRGNYAGKKTLYFNINPKGTSIKSLKNGNNSFTVEWYKRTKKMSQTRITGYQIQYSKKSDFSNATTVRVPVLTTTGEFTSSKKVKDVKPGNYYVRIRTYKIREYTDGKSYFYSGWKKYKSRVYVW